MFRKERPSDMEGTLEQEFLLSKEEIEQAIILSRFSMQMLYCFLGLVLNTYSLPSLVLFFEEIGHAEDMDVFVARLEEIGREEGANILAAVKVAICEQWGYCRRRSTDGLGDPRHFIQVLAPVIGPELSKRYSSGKNLDRSFLITACVFVARSNLGKLCNCR